VRSALRSDSYLLPRDNPFRSSEAVEDPSADVLDDPREPDKLTFTTEIGAALVSGIGGK
jgi:hypothetical protein